jgi:manganese oxidase
LADRYYASVHPHGVLYDKANEGAPYNDGTTQHDDDVVAPNATYTYTWQARA